MSLAEVQLHELRKLELRYRLLFFLRDIGIKSAKAPAVKVWNHYMDATAQLILTETVEGK
jgi:hypothetical protein